MKKKRNFIMALAAILALGAVSCDKDDEKDDSLSPNVEAVVGSYNGILIESINGENRDTTEATIVITADGNENVRVVLPAFGEGGMALMECAVGQVAVNKDGNSYTIVKENYEQTLTKPDGSNIVYTGSISGQVTDGRLSLEYNVKPGAMPMSIHFSFNQ